MSEDGPAPGEAAGGPDREPAWKVDAAESLARSRRTDERAGGRLVYVDGAASTAS